LLLCLAGCTTYQPVDWSERAGMTRAQPPHADAGEGAETARHRVARGETLSGLAVRYRVRLSDLARANRIAPPYRLYAGQYLTVPERAGTVDPPAARAVAAVVPARRTVPPIPAPVPKPSVRGVQVASLEPQPTESAIAPPLPRERLEASRGAAGSEPPPLSGDGFLWPVRGKIASGFGSKPNGTRNDGVNIRAREGAAVVAAENGVVVFAGEEIPGYGRMLLISHANGFLTAYAHNRDLLVAVGERVERGQPIAAVGRTGNVTSPQLHFEVRDGKEPVDPALVLVPASTQVASVR
jgi:murein DD-endopeptidase MepM/ murein hydrolase activator NlpD